MPGSSAKTMEKTRISDALITSRWQLVLGTLLVVCTVAVRTYCGLFMIIADCDETYNYWEPLNVIFRRFGKQTWEYLPAYAIRSYAYLIPYYLLTAPMRDADFLLLARLPSYYYFYAIRTVLLAGFSAFTEYKLFCAVKKHYSSFAANWYLLFSTFAPGMSHAGVALLPSAFAMTWVTWGTALALDSITLINDSSIVWPSVHAFVCFTVAGLVGWPFALALAVPFAVFSAKARYQTVPLALILGLSGAGFAVVFAALLAVDSYFYSRKLLFVPINIVLYNVFALDGEGPDIFGVEPFLYYVKNLFLNFNVVFPLGYVGAIVGAVWSPQKLKTAFAVSAPLIVWGVVFGRQPHKEERFLYPIYPLICVSAAIFTSQCFEMAKRSLGMPRALIRLGLMVSMGAYITVSVLRILSLVANYSAPLTTVHALHESAATTDKNGIKNVCIGREWYHFPTSFFLPDNYRLRFVQSGFDGLLPGDFVENASLKTIASTYPSGMNSKNQFSSDKVVAFAECDFYIDNSLPIDESSGEPKVISKENGVLQVDPEWEILSCDGIINPDGDHRGVGRILYVPEFARAFVPYHVEHMDYCVLQRKQR